ncbi:MAG: hypothetical protein ABSH19_06115, partial [Opitutales bacterium]
TGGNSSGSDTSYSQVIAVNADTLAIGGASGSTTTDEGASSSFVYSGASVTFNTSNGLIGYSPDNLTGSSFGFFALGVNGTLTYTISPNATADGETSGSN